MPADFRASELQKRGRMLRSLAPFVAIGAILFAIAPRASEPRAIHVSAEGLLARERAQATREAVPSLTPEKAREVDARVIEDEVLYREDLRLGLDRDDPIVRERVIQKLLLLVEDMGGASRAPSDAELRAFFAKDPSRWREATRIHLVHVFASTLAALPGTNALGTNAGEPFPYPRDVTASKVDLARTYGDDFTKTALEAPLDTWSDPVASPFGWHRVRVLAREGGRIPKFEEARDAVAFDYAMDLRESVIGAYLKKTANDYAIDVDGQRLTSFSPTRRVAMRAESSAED